MAKTHPVIDAWFKDPGFNELSNDVKVSKIEGFFDKNLASDDFYRESIEDQDRYRTNFISNHFMGRKKKKPESTGMVEGLARDVAGGAVDAAEGVLRAVRAVPGGQEGGVSGEDWASQGIKGIEGYRDKTPFLQSQKHEGTSRWLHEGVRSVSQSLISNLPAMGAGAVAGIPAGPVGMFVGALAGRALGGGVVFGLSEYDRSKEAYLKENPKAPIEEAESYALVNGGAEFAGELVSDIVQAVTMGKGGVLSKATKPVAKNAVGNILKQLFKSTFKVGKKDMAKRVALTVGSEVAGELGTAYVQAENARKYSMGDQKGVDAAIDAFGPTLVASMLFSGIAETGRFATRQSLEKSLNNPNADIGKRLKAAAEVQKAIEKDNPELAKVWEKTSLAAINNKEAIDTKGAIEPVALAGQEVQGKQAIEGFFGETGEKLDMPLSERADAMIGQVKKDYLAGKVPEETINEYKERFPTMRPALNEVIAEKTRKDIETRLKESGVIQLPGGEAPLLLGDGSPETDIPVSSEERLNMPKWEVEQLKRRSEYVSHLQEGYKKGLRSEKELNSLKEKYPEIADAIDNILKQGEGTPAKEGVESLPDGALTTMAEFGQGPLPLNLFTLEERDILEKAGLVDKFDNMPNPETGEVTQFTGVHPESLWEERDRRYEQDKKRRSDYLASRDDSDDAGEGPSGGAGVAQEPELTRKETAFNEMADRLTAADTRYIQDRGGITEDLPPEHLQNTLSDIFAPDKYGVQPVKLEEIGFTPGQITEMKKEGFASPDGTMSEPQFDEWIQVQQEQKVEELGMASEASLEQRASEPFQQDRGGLIEETKPTQEMAEWRQSVEGVLPQPAWQGVEAAVAPVTPTTPDVKQEPIPKGASEPIVDSEVPGVGKDTNQVHDFSSTQVNIPQTEAKSFQEFGAKIPDAEIYEDPKDPSYGREDEPHITVKYGLDTVDPKEVEPLLADQGPITIKMGKVSIFESDDFDVVKVDIESPELHAVNKKIADNLKVTDTYPDYKPHATIAYVKKGEGKKYVGDKSFEGKEIVLNSLTFSGKDGKLTEIPLKGEKLTSVLPTPGQEPTPANVKEPWESSDLATSPQVPVGQTQAKKQKDGSYKLFYKGTTKEIFKGQTFKSAPASKKFFKEQQKKALEARTTRKPGKPSGLAPTSGIEHTDGLKKSNGYAWRSMTQAALKKLTNRLTTFGGPNPKAGKKVAPFPKSAIRYAKVGSYLVEFDGAGKTEGETSENVLGKDNITRIMKLEEYGWRDVGVTFDDKVLFQDKHKEKLKQKAIREAKNIRQWIAAMGGFKRNDTDRKGEWDDILGKGKTSGRGYPVGFFDGTTGQGFDIMYDAAKEHGWIGPEATEDDFMAAIMEGRADKFSMQGSEDAMMEKYAEELKAAEEEFLRSEQEAKDVGANKESIDESERSGEEEGVSEAKNERPKKEPLVLEGDKETPWEKKARLEKEKGGVNVKGPKSKSKAVFNVDEKVERKGDVGKQQGMFEKDAQGDMFDDIPFSKTESPPPSKASVSRVTRLIDKLITAKGRKGLGIDIVETVDDLKRKLGIFGDGNLAKEETLEGIDPDTLSKEVLSKMNRTLKADGYAVRGSEDIKALLKRGRSLRNPDWISAYQKAIGSVAKRKETLKKKSDYKNINWSRMRELGNTTDLKEAGYIKPDGTLADLSGKKEGGEPGSRSYDHREAGGTNGMQELMAYGHIRMDNNSGSLDIAKEPTAQQYGVIREIAQNHNGALIIDLEDGLGAEKADYYSSPERTFSKKYPEGVKANRIVNDIKRFFSGETPVPLNVIYAKDGETILGAYHPQTGRITLVAQSLHKDNAWSTVLHEVVHQAKDKEGWKGVFGTRSPRIIKSIEKKIAEGDKAWKAAEAKALKWKSPDTDLLEETITYYLADNANADQGLFRRILNAIRAWAVNAGIKREISSKDLVALAENMVQRKAQGEAKNVSQPSVFAEARMSKEQKAAKWYSQMEKFLAEKLPGKGTPESMKQMLNSWAKKGEYKAEELSWSGVLDWLDTTDFKKLHERQATDKNIKSQDEFDPLGIIKGEYKVALPESSNKVLKQDVLDYLAENNVRIEEVVKGGPAGAWTVWDETTEEESYFETKQEAKDYWRSINGASEDLFFKENTGKEDPKYSQYQVPGGENYKELLLTLPGKKGKNDGEIADLKAKLEQTIGSPEDVMALEELTKSDTNYKSTHWPDNPNVLAHIRFNERTVDGKRVLFIEEIQSDWASDIRKKGVKNPELGSVERKALEDRLADIQKRLRPKAVDDGDVQRHAELSHEENAIYAKLNSTGTPNAPWQKTYYLKAMQRMVRYAAENGFDSVSWTPGSVHSNRWGTEKIAWKREGKYNKGWDKSITGKINKLKMQRADAEWASEEWFAIEAKLGELQKQLPEENSWFVSVKEQVGGNADNIDIEAEADTRGLNVQNSELVKSKAHLKELIGRIAQRTRSEYSEANYKAMVDARTDKVWDAMQTDDEGVSFPRKESFESIYDKKIVNDVNKFFGKKAWGKAKVGKDTILTTDFYGPDAKLDKDLLLESGEGVEVHTLPITEQMRSKAMTEGMPRFAKEEKESFADNYLKQFIEAQPKAKQAAVKAKVQKEKKRIEKELPDIQKSLWDTVRNLPAVKEGKPDVKAWQGLLSIPAHYFNDVAALGRMYMNGTKSGDNRSLMTDKITKAEDDHYYTADLDSLKRPSLRLPRETRQAMKAAYKSLTKYLKHRDQKQVGYSILENEETKQWDLYHYKDKKRQKPIGSFNGEAEAVDAMIQAEANDYRAAGATDQAADALIASRRISNNGFNMLSQAIRQLREQYEKRGEQLPSEIVNVDGKAVTVDLKLALSSMGDMRGFYMPRIRKPGRFVAFATKDGANPIRKHFEFKKFAQKWVVEQRRKGYKANIDKLQKMPEDVFEMAGKVVAHEALINEALAKVNGKDHALEDFGLRYADRRDNNKRLFIVAGPTSKKLNEALKENGGRWRSVDKGGPKHWVFENPGRNFEKRLAKGIAYYNESMDFDTKSQALFAKVLTEQVSNIIKARGARQHMIGRRDAVGKEVWEGYEEDPAEAMGRYARGIAAGEAKKIMARDMLANFTGTDISWQEFKGMSEDGATYEDFMNFVQERRVDPKKQPNAFKDGKIFMEDMLRNEEAVDRLMGFIRGLAVLKYLAGRVSAPVINLTAMATSVPATMNGLGGIPLNKVPKHLAQAGKMYHQYAFGKEDALPADIRLVFDTIYDNGWQESQLNREAMAVLRSKAGRGWDKMMDMGMMGFGVTEKINRVTTITGAYLGLKAQGGTDHDVMMAKAKEISDKSHGTYGKVNYPLLARGKHPAAHILKAFYVFQTFTHNYLLTMREMYGDKVLHPAHKKALAYMAISPAVLAGAGGMVGWDILMKVIGSALGIDEPEEEIYKWLYENIGRHAEDLARFGLFGTLGINIKGSLAIGGIPDIPTNLVDLAGAPGSVVMDVYHGLENITKGDVSKGLEKIAPLAIGNPIKAYREYTEGLTTRSNTPLYFGNKQVKADMTDALLRTFSFNPAKIARVREIQWSEKQKERKYREMKSDINRRIKAFYVQPIADRGKGEWADILEDIREYNLRISKAGMVGTVPLITAKSIASFVRRSFKPPKRERMRQVR